MITYLTTRKEQKMELNGDLLTGSTFAIKDYIKAYLGGKFDGAVKGWHIDIAKLEKLLGNNSIGLRIDPDGGKTQAKSGNLSPAFVNTKYGVELGEDY